MSIPSVPSGDRGYRPEIQGLRAVAALMVAVYHVWFGRVSGGVDVFFVVSAFMVTTKLLRYVETRGHVQFVEFWSGLARRLLPASMLVLFTVAVASIAWLPRPLWGSTIPQVLASALYLENWQLAFDAVDYMQQGVSASPVQHYWALSVQGQFYLAWPLLIAAASWWAARKGLPFRRVVAFAFLGVFTCSLSYSVYATRTDQAFAYFNTFTRVWELGLGAMLALAPRIQISKGARLVGGWVGLIGIVACGMVFQVSRVFPGYAALWPTGCALLIMLSGVSGSRFGADRLLSSRPFVYLGGISYGLYLWHWPVLVFWRWFTLQQPVQLFGGLAVIGLSIGLAALSTRLVENPIRRTGRGPATGRTMARFVALNVVPVLAVALAWGTYFEVQRRHDGREVLTTDPDYPGARSREAGFHYAGDPGVAPYPGLLAVEDDLPALYARGCNSWDADWQRANCIFGDTRSTRTIALVGASRAAHWFPALDILAREQGWRIVSYARSDCVFSVETGDIVLKNFCRRHNARLLQILLEDRPDVVVTTGTRGSGSEEHIPDGFLRRWAQLERAGIKVIAIRETPWMKLWVPECLAMRGTEDLDACSQPVAEVIATPSPIDVLAARPANVHFVDMTRYFCDETRCPPMIGNVIVYRDPSHMTASYAKTLAPMLMKEMSPGLPVGWITSREPGSTASEGRIAASARNEPGTAAMNSVPAVAE